MDYGRIGVIVRGPLAMGLLTDKFSASDTFPKGDFRKAWIEDPEEKEQFLVDLDTVARIREVVPDEDTMAQYALRFVLMNPAVTSVIPGARSRLQAEANTAAGRRPPLSDPEMAAGSRGPSGWRPQDLARLDQQGSLSIPQIEARGQGSQG